jgi:F-type H+-transporting ATPase subunit a
VEHPYLFLTSLFGIFGMEEWAAAHPHVTYMWMAMIILIILGWLGGKSVSLVPKTAQNVFEVIISGLEEFMVSLTGEEGRKSFPLLLTIFLFVLTGNLMGLVPALYPPTANINTTVALAIIAVTWSHVIGIKIHGAKYIKHFLGPVPALMPLFLIIELIGHAARVLSLTLRLFGNMMGHELVVGILLMLAGPFLVPLPIMAMGILVAFIQAIVFFLLPTMYIAGAIEEAH